MHADFNLEANEIAATHTTKNINTKHHLFLYKSQGRKDDDKVFVVVASFLLW